VIWPSQHNGWCHPPRRAGLVVSPHLAEVQSPSGQGDWTSVDWVSLRGADLTSSAPSRVQRGRRDVTTGAWSLRSAGLPGSPDLPSF
jgi:hypothetical protein